MPSHGRVKYMDTSQFGADSVPRRYWVCGSSRAAPTISNFLKLLAGALRRRPFMIIVVIVNRCQTG